MNSRNCFAACSVVVAPRSIARSGSESAGPPSHTSKKERVIRSPIPCCGPLSASASRLSAFEVIDITAANKAS